MFLTDCQACGLRELRGARSIETLVSTGSSIELVYRCTECATLNLMAGSHRTQPVPAPAAPATAAA